MSTPIHSEVDRDHSPGQKRRTVREHQVHWPVGRTIYRLTVPEGFAYKPTGFAALRVLTLGLIRRYEAEDFSMWHDALYCHEDWKKREDASESSMGGRIRVERVSNKSHTGPRWVPCRPSRRVADHVAYATDTDRRWVQHVLYYATRAFGRLWW